MKEEKQADVSGTKICPSCKGSGQDTTITAFTGVCGNCNGTGKVAADVSIESLAKEKYPYPENDLYKEGDPDLEEMFWVVDGLRQAFKAGYAAANQPKNEIKDWKENELKDVYDKMKKDMDRLAELEKEVVKLRRYETVALKLAASNFKENQTQPHESIEDKIEKIAGILYANKSDEGDEGSWINSEDFYKVAKKIAAAKDGQEDGWISVDNDYPECAAGERNYSIDVEAKFPDGNTCKGHFELEDGYFYDGDTLYQYLEKPTHWRSLSSTAESGQRTPADDAVEDKDFDAWLENNYQESDFKGFWIDRDNWIDKNNPYYRMEDLKVLWGQRSSR